MFLNYLTFITVAPFIQLHIIFNASIVHFAFSFVGLFVFPNEWCFGVCDTEWKKTGTAMNADFYFFSFSLTNKQNYRCTQPRTCIKLVMRNLGRLSRMRMLFFLLFFLTPINMRGRIGGLALRKNVDSYVSFV